MDTLVSNLQFIIVVPELLITLLFCAFMGICCFSVAFHLTIYKDLRNRLIKYLVATCSISFTSAAFIILLNPFLFSEISSYLILSKSLFFILQWVFLAEVLHIARVGNGKYLRYIKSKIHQRLTRILF